MQLFRTICDNSMNLYTQDYFIIILSILKKEWSTMPTNFENMILKYAVNK